MQMQCNLNQNTTRGVSRKHKQARKTKVPSRVTTRDLEGLYLGWVPKVFYMQFGSKVEVPKPADSLILTHYRLIWTEFSSGEYISLWLHGDENLTKT